jgi:hypothetical protein
MQKCIAAALFGLSVYNLQGCTECNPDDMVVCFEAKFMDISDAAALSEDAETTCGGMQEALDCIRKCCDDPLTEEYFPAGTTGKTFTASVVAAAGALYTTDEAGETSPYECSLQTPCA